MNIQDNIKKIKRNVPNNVTIIGVTKYINSCVANELIASGISDLAESRPDGFLEKYVVIGDQVIWHFIGTLQTRKVRDVINKIDYLHSLDRLSLAQEINKRTDNKINCFVQINTSKEENKHGLAENEVMDFIKQISIYDKIQIVGLMTMAPNTSDETVVRSCFSRLRQLQQRVQKLSLPHAPCIELSMGMTNDYQIAIEEGATFVRLGRCLVE